MGLEFYLLSQDSWISSFRFGMAAAKYDPPRPVPGERKRGVEQAVQGQGSIS